MWDTSGVLLSSQWHQKDLTKYELQKEQKKNHGRAQCSAPQQCYNLHADALHFTLAESSKNNFTPPLLEVRFQSQTCYLLGKKNKEKRKKARVWMASSLWSWGKACVFILEDFFFVTGKLFQGFFPLCSTCISAVLILKLANVLLFICVIHISLGRLKSTVKRKADVK